MDVNDIVSKLEDSVKADNATVEPSTAEKETVATEASKTDSGTKKGTAQERIQELVAERKAFEDRLKDAETKLTQKDSELGKLIDTVKQQEVAARVVDKINNLYYQGKFKAEIEAIDAAIKGVEQQASNIQAAAETVKPSDNSDLLKLQQATQRNQEEALSAIAAQKNELLLMKSQLVVEKLFANLPDTDYNEQDRKVLQNALVDHVDWEAIEEDPNSLESVVSKGFQETVSWYGDPRGKLAQNKPNTVTDESKGVTATEPVDFTKLEVGKLAKDDKGAYKPVINDNEFAAILAQAMREEQAKKRG